jgi:uncharacterized SAM-binding protein YcdF (DUF218 family)
VRLFQKFVNLPDQTAHAVHFATKERTFLFRHRWTLTILAAVALGLASLLCFGGYLLVASEPLPQHAQVAVMLDGSLAGVRARRAEAMRLLGEGKVDQVMLSLGETTYWGESLPEVAHRYLTKQYGPALADQVVVCIAEVSSTAEEAEALRPCLEQHGWRSIIVVTSNYHTRRARKIWRETLAKANPPFILTVHGVFDGDFQPRGWWRQRTYAKTWLLEVTKLAWASIFGIHVWK